ncbi:nitroreductase family protein [Bacillus sp. FSL W7-1360]
MADYRQFELVERLIEASGQFHLTGKDDIQSLGWKHAHDGENIFLPTIKKGGFGLQEALEKRMAIRMYDFAPVDLEDIGTVLSASVEGDMLDWSEQREVGIDLSVFVISWRVDGLDCPAVYRYQKDHHALIKVGEAPSQEEGGKLFLQKEFSWAPAVVVISGSLRTSVDYYGSHGYRHLLIRGGAAGYRAWLAALTLGYEGSVFAGMLPVSARELLKIDGHNEAQLFAFSFGRPVRFA